MRIIGIILAGGESQRMSCPQKQCDKALVKLAGKRLFDHVLARLAPQVDSVIIAGPSDYGSGLTTLTDIPGGAEGPVAGIRATYNWLVQKGETGIVIVTVPVDCPFLPADLVKRLAAADTASVAEGDHRLQPAFGFWPQTVIEKHIAALERPGWLSLQRWAKLCDAETVSFGATGAFFNINDEDELAEAERLVTNQIQS